MRNDLGRVPHSCMGEGEDYVLFSFDPKDGVFAVVIFERKNKDGV